MAKPLVKPRKRPVPKPPPRLTVVKRPEPIAPIAPPQFFVEFRTEVTRKLAALHDTMKQLEPSFKNMTAAIVGVETIVENLRTTVHSHLRQITEALVQTHGALVADVDKMKLRVTAAESATALVQTENQRLRDKIVEITADIKPRS